MAKVAIVTGGTRGIGAAISKGLKAAGCTVAASYAGNDAAAAKFKDETGIARHVSNGTWRTPLLAFAGVKQVESGPRPHRRALKQCRHHARRHVP